MEISFCTLFDSNYLDKGIALVNSLNRVSKNFELYVYAFDNKAYEILSIMSLDRVKVILFEDIISDELKEIRRKRTRAEFCWTCTPYIIEYTLKQFDVKMCTYIDADLYFFSDPKVLIDEMLEMNCSVQIVEHRFPQNRKYRVIESGSGKFCVEFNTFLNNDKGLEILDWWRKQCFSCCTSDWNQGSFGDQKYLEEWQDRFGSVNVLQNHGGGVAPWNIGRYKKESNSNEQGIQFREKGKKTKYKLIFYHFHDLHFIDKKYIDINIYTRHKYIDKSLVDAIYKKYLTELVTIRKMLEKNYKLLLPNVQYETEHVLWDKKENLSFIQKMKRIVLSPQNLYYIKVLRKKDIVEVR